MKKRRRNLLAFSNEVLSAALILLGFSSCSGGESPDEYGSPYAKYEIKGKVVDEEQEVIPNARILMNKGVLIGGDAIGFSPTADTVYTEKDGTYFYNADGEVCYMFRITCEDPSGVHKAETTEVTPELVDGNGWYEGIGKEEVNFELKKKENKE